MRKALLLYNPTSGRRPKRRIADVEAVVNVLQQAGVEVKASVTGSAIKTVEQSRRAIAEGCDTIIACGGDGTVHDVLQALVGTQAALAVIPLGTANALAHDLRIPLAAVPAARSLLTSRPQRLAAGKIAYRSFCNEDSSRYFTVTAGVGVDAHLFYKLNVLVKGRFGMLAYYMKATRLWLTHDMPKFGASILTPDEKIRSTDLSQLLAVRITQFGGILRELAPGAALTSNDLRLVLFKTQNRMFYLAYILRGLLGQNWKVSGIEFADTKQVSCRLLSDPDPRIYVEADGELLGTLPAEITIVPDAFTLLVP